MKRLEPVLIAAVLVLALGQPAFSLPSYGASCTNCHTGSRGTMTITGNDTSADPLEACGSPDRGALQVFQITQGSTKALSGTLAGLAQGATYATLIKGFEGTGAEQCGTLSYSGDSAWQQQSTTPPVYFTSSTFTWPAQSTFDFNITVGATTPPDYYDLTLATAGRDGSGRFYTESHFYVQVMAPAAAVPSITLNHTSLTPSVAQGASPPDDTFTVANSGQGTLNYTISSDATWLTVSPTGGSSTGPANTHTVQYSTATLAPGNHAATITVTDPTAANNPQVMNVSLTVTPAGSTGTPTIVLDKTTLTANAAQGASPADAAFTVSNAGQGVLNYAITSDAPWLTISPTGGSSAGAANTHTVQYSTTALAAGTYPATITVTDPNAANNPQTIAVSLTIAGAPTQQPPSDDSGNEQAGQDTGQDDEGSSPEQSVPDDDAQQQSDDITPITGICGTGTAAMLPALLLGLAGLRTDLLRRKSGTAR